MSLEDYKKEMIICRLCGICCTECPTASIKIFESYSPRGRIILSELLMRGRVEPTPELVDRIFSCTTCGRCNVTCPSHVEAREIIEATRVRLVELDRAPPSVLLNVVKSIKETGNSTGESQRLRLEPFKGIKNISSVGSETLFYVGCMPSYRYQNLARATAQILKMARYDFKILGEEEACCADPILSLGLREDFTKLAERNVESFERLGIREIVTVCPMCFKAFKVDYPAVLGKMDFEVLHVTELISRLIEEGRIEFSKQLPLRVTYHDPCHLGRQTGVYDPPRKVLMSIPSLEFVEMNGYNRELAWCCGGPIRMSYTELAVDVSETIGRRAKEVGADALVTACPTCMHSLSVIAFDYDLQIYDVVELVAAAMGLSNLK